MMENVKAVIVIDSGLPPGVIANTAAILGITLGRLAPQCVGGDVTDASGLTHRGIVTIPVPILKGDRDSLRALRGTLFTEAYGDLEVVDFSDVAQGCGTYSEYASLVSETEEGRHNYFGVAIFGNRKKVSKLTGSLPLLR